MRDLKLTPEVPSGRPRSEIDRMDAFYERLLVRAATFDELLSDDFEPLPGQKTETNLATDRLGAWCRSCASGDWSLFGRRLARDGLAFAEVLTRFATVRRKPSASLPSWLIDAAWILEALQSSGAAASSAGSAECAFENLFLPLVKQAGEVLWSSLGAQSLNNLTDSARACLCHSLLNDLSNLGAPAIYERFAAERKNRAQNIATAHYAQFCEGMRATGFQHLFEDKPVLLRLFAVVVRQWIETSRKFIQRLDGDLPAIRRELVSADDKIQVARIGGNCSDPHNGGFSVKIVTFTDGSRVVYKPKDVRAELVWRRLVERLNDACPPIELKTARTLMRDRYGWAEFVDHTGCADREGCKRYFRRAGAWLALFHCFAVNDMHQENIIAAGEHPVPIDLETILQSANASTAFPEPEAEAFYAATEKLANSVMMVGLLPVYGRSPENKVYAIGGLTADWSSKIKIKWEKINTDEMRPTRSKDISAINLNLPRVGGCYAKLDEHVDDVVSGFEDYARFLLGYRRDVKHGEIFEDFRGVPVRRIVRATRFYSMLLQRLTDHRSMGDGVIWSVQSDFIARLAEWEKDTDYFWPLLRSERSDLLAMNIPHFISPCDGNETSDAAGHTIRHDLDTGLALARTRFETFNEEEINWQVQVIRENMRTLSKSAIKAPVNITVRSTSSSGAAETTTSAALIKEADKIAEQLAARAIRRGPGAAWIGLDWLGDADIFQLVCLGSDLYNGTSGIGVFLAAHAAVTGNHASRDLARAGVAYLRKNLKSRDAARMARSMGVGGATGLGSIVYALTLMASYLRDDTLLADAHVAAQLITDDLIAADKQLDIIGGSAGAILCLLRLYRDGRSEAVLRRAVKCGEHVIAQSQVGQQGHRSWVGQGSGQRALNGMSHGAAGFAYALASLSSATGRDDFAQAAAGCIEFENSSFNAERANWPDLRGDAPAWPCQWCHGATGIGLARIGMARQAGMTTPAVKRDVQLALEGVQLARPAPIDTLCCGTLGSIEFFCEAANTLGRNDLHDLALQRLADVLVSAASHGDYRWNSGNGRFNLGLFRGCSGVGYTALRRVDDSIANILIWE
jgi:type 2 lantibiotic biosynthesis protein LanM